MLGTTPHKVFVAPRHSLCGQEEEAIKSPLSEQEVIVRVSLDTFLHLVALGATTSVPLEKIRTKLGIGLTEFLNSRVCPLCWADIEGYGER